MSTNRPFIEQTLQAVLKILHTSVPENEQQIIRNLIEDKEFWTAANIMGAMMNSPTTTLDQKIAFPEAIKVIRETMGQLARTSTAPTTVIFGTSGWRGIIGEDFTIRNVHKVAKAIIEMMKTPVFLTNNGYSSFEDVRNHGILVFRDNRYLGDDFKLAVMQELAKEEILIYDAGECPTGVGSALVTQLSAAGSINITPSHNPMDYSGLKFNPSDGGPADTNLTDLIMEQTIPLMNAHNDFAPSNTSPNVIVVNPIQEYSNYLNKQYQEHNGLINLSSLQSFLHTKKDEIYILVDNMHGSSRGYIEGILGKDVINELKESGSIGFINTNDDYSFHGVKPEPNAFNQALLIKMAQEKVAQEPKRRLTLVAALDPDADRIRFGTATTDINMNQFGAIAYGHLLKKGILGPIATTLPSSKFALRLAKMAGQNFYQEKVGFKWFRPLKDAIVKYEESDGISFRGHTLEKDGIAGFLMAIQIMAENNMDIAQFLEKLQEQAGYFYARQTPHEIADISIDDWIKLRLNVEQQLQTQYSNINIFAIETLSKKVASTSTIDGIMLTFDDDSWLLVRSSGTEPKFRIYYEVTSQIKLSDEQRTMLLNQYASAGLKILSDALAQYGR